MKNKQLLALLIGTIFVVCASALSSCGSDEEAQERRLKNQRIANGTPLTHYQFVAREWDCSEYIISAENSPTITYCADNVTIEFDSTITTPKLSITYGSISLYDRVKMVFQNPQQVKLYSGDN